MFGRFVSIILLVGATAAAGGLIYYLATSGYLKAPDILKAPPSGIRGTVTIGPTCPVEKNPPDPKCADKPAGAEFTVANKAGYTVTTATSAATDGKFEVLLEPGEYTIALTKYAGNPIARASAQSFTVTSGTFVSIAFRLDSGIR